MATHEYERPWQVMPAKTIKLALEYAEKDNDFDRQLAYLLLDIGMEAALKAFLISKGHNVEKLVFPELLKKVKEELSKTNPELIHQIDDVGYLHGIRNKLYHQGDGVTPTEDNLKRYSDIAKKIVWIVLEVNLETQEKEYLVDIEGYQRKIEIRELARDIEERFKYFQESCALVTEKLRPNYGTREFALQLNFIVHSWPDEEEDDPRERVQNQIHRLEKYNELTGRNATNHDFIDFILEDINHLYVRIAFQETSDNLQDNWTQYIDILKRQSHLLHNWKQGIYSEHLTVQQVRDEYQEIVAWIEAQQEKLDKWIDDHIPGIFRPTSFGFIDVL